MLLSLCLNILVAVTTVATAAVVIIVAIAAAVVILVVVAATVVVGVATVVIVGCEQQSFYLNCFKLWLVHQLRSKLNFWDRSFNHSTIVNYVSRALIK